MLVIYLTHHRLDYIVYIHSYVSLEYVFMCDIDHDKHKIFNNVPESPK